MRGVLGLFAALLTILLPSAAFAEDGQWLRAEGSRFIVYGQESEDALRRAVLDLQAYHETMSLVTGVRPDGPAPKLEIYLVRNHDELRIALPGVPNDLWGLYLAEAEMVAAIVVFVGDHGPGLLSGLETLFHEYAHHLMAQHASAAYPTWYAEGFADYFAPTRLKEDVVEVGVIPDYRVAWLAQGHWLPLKTVLFEQHWSLPSGAASLYYSQSWLLAHYLFEKAERIQQLQRYLARLNDGAAPITAFREGFGMEVEALDQELRAYAQGKLSYVAFPRSRLKGGDTVVIARLPKSYDDLLLLEYRVKSGLERGKEGKTLDLIRKHAAAYPGDEFAQRVLARVEIFHGDAAEGAAIAEAGLAARPNDPDWLYLKGIGQLKLGFLEPEARAEHYRSGRRALALANKLRPDHVPTLYRYARSFFGDKDEPSQRTTDILFQAAQLSPQIAEVVMTTSYALMVRDEFPQAVRLLKGIANAPHGGGLAEKARLLLRSAEKSELPPATSSYLAR